MLLEDGYHETKKRFIKLIAKGYPIDAIAKTLGKDLQTLIDWNKELEQEIIHVKEEIEKENLQAIHDAGSRSSEEIEKSIEKRKKEGWKWRNFYTDDGKIIEDGDI